jgi:hypothetical protein
MKDLSRLLWALFGAIVGLGLGFAAYIGVQAVGGKSLQAFLDNNATVSLLLIGGLCLGGLAGGGTLVLTILNRIERKQRKKYFDEKKQKRKQARSK